MHNSIFWMVTLSVCPCSWVQFQATTRAAGSSDWAGNGQFPEAERLWGQVLVGGEAKPAGCKGLFSSCWAVIESKQDMVPCGKAGAGGDVSGCALVCWAAPGSQHQPRS